MYVCKIVSRAVPAHTEVFLFSRKKGRALNCLVSRSVLGNRRMHLDPQWVLLNLSMHGNFIFTCTMPKHYTPEMYHHQHATPMNERARVVST